MDKAEDALKEAALSRDANEHKPIRDAVVHTALLTRAAKGKLSSVRENIKGRVQTILSMNYQATVNVSYLGGQDWGWDGTFSFSPGE